VATVLVTAAVLVSRSRRFRHASEPADALTKLRDELEALREENALLRSEQQRALNVGKAAAVIREEVEALAASAGDRADDEWSALAETMVLRATLVAACEDLQDAIHHVHAQLTTGIPGPELDARGAPAPDRPPAGGRSPSR
jgi:hypothetical protein